MKHVVRSDVGGVEKNPKVKISCEHPKERRGARQGSRRVHGPPTRNFHSRVEREADTRQKGVWIVEFTFPSFTRPHWVR